uniref:Dephospho-CoA kinase n=1 Tax=Panagrolaimus sp. PS1159 TaxID=55785 RepID=A0AC35F7F0_9BILA
MYLVGLTGGISTGKSTAVKTLRNRGITVIDADELARDVVKPGELAYNQLRKIFGNEFFDEETGELNREKLSAVVFEDSKKRSQLNSVTHPAVGKAMFKQIISHLFKGDKFVVLDIPLLFESGAHRFVQKTIVVHCDEEKQLERLMKRDTVDEKVAKSRIAAQMPLKDKMERATYLIDNNHGKEEAEKQINKIADELENSWLPLIIRSVFGIFLGFLILSILKIVF